MNAITNAQPVLFLTAAVAAAEVDPFFDGPWTPEEQAASDAYRANEAAKEAALEAFRAWWQSLTPEQQEEENHKNFLASMDNEPADVDCYPEWKIDRANERAYQRRLQAEAEAHEARYPDRELVSEVPDGKSRFARYKKASHSK